MSEIDKDNSEKLIEELPSEHIAGPRISTLKSQGERTRNGHVFIDRDTDISYYDNSIDNLEEVASSSSFLAVNSAVPSHLIFIGLAHLVALGWLIFVFC